MSNNKTRTTGVPKFLRHLYAILHTEDSSIMSWSMDGMCIQLFNVKRLEAEVLPKYFKHNKLSSFQRQLNYFGFRKWTKTQSCVCTFSHAQLNGHSTPDTMAIPRKHATTPTSFDSYVPEACDALVWPTDDLVFDDADLKVQDWDLCIDSFDDASFDWLKAIDTPLCMGVLV
ncbi:hypothetical protein AaE_005480 [Aphanomyces astaci]|uniref:HSF-type DNA-binding domain-containing protein n=1 Tax=Aphanomyces astaci TaxID=112090 RepID=A0A6A5AIS6_APHAT|nr:hypothetical protein AaE_005480 [Aphanomyces astaci]